MSFIEKITPFLQELKTRQLGTLLKSIGANTTGRKSDLVTRCATELSRESRKKVQGPVRILSIDMGVKNLAFCLCDIDLPQPRSGTQTGDDLPRIEVKTWKCMSLMNDRSTTGTESSRVEDVYHPRNMSRLALNLVESEWLPLRPSRILIERQRFRTSRSPQIQEWTVRVNMLESMLYAIFAATTTRPANQDTSIQSDAIEGISPARVATFWSRSDGGDQDAGQSKSLKGSANARAVKKEKIDLVRRWTQDPTSAPFTLRFSGPTGQMRQHFAVGKTKGQKSHGASEESEEFSQPAKLDDLADCLLQAAAWVKWEANRHIMTHADIGSVQDLETLLASLQQQKM